MENRFQVHRHAEAIGPRAEGAEWRLSPTPFPAVESKVRLVKEGPPSAADARTWRHRNVLSCKGPIRGPWTLHVNSTGRAKRTLNDTDLTHHTDPDPPILTRAARMMSFSPLRGSS
jgi:hypothetical protein